MFMFLLMDEGQCKSLIADSDLGRIASFGRSAIESHLAEHGFGDDDDEELKTDDGYAKVVRVTPGVPESEEHVWSYSFDGQVSLNYAFSLLQAVQQEQ
ncbi:hypothetical protein [Paenibacillus abyssi]|uniref:Uncharacterized protein n=1 Tax=Paenibacillus abyssi TaxID=1340531 RepID=A0A917G1W6_9BACL|nr:hypothetical protein [Paenibacillus abyssi]GGG18292.1 hypothetical protein GCM10010916_38910 [Paenibacillus abyssi]